ncbi:hypothetical protein ASD86_14505 [Lysobacter sp. Root690]|nr:hypothetical protein ASD86_14505 [Lysobacter sp. Root690]
MTLLAIADDSKRNRGQSRTRRGGELVDARSPRCTGGGGRREHATAIATAAAMDCDSGHSFAAITREG